MFEVIRDVEPTDRILIDSALRRVENSNNSNASKSRDMLGAIVLGDGFYTTVANRLAIRDLTNFGQLEPLEIEALLASDPTNTEVKAEIDDALAFRLFIKKQNVPAVGIVKTHLVEAGVPRNRWSDSWLIALDIVVPEPQHYLPSSLAEKFANNGIHNGIRRKDPYRFHVAWILPENSQANKETIQNTHGANILAELPHTFTLQAARLSNSG